MTTFDPEKHISPEELERIRFPNGDPVNLRAERDAALARCAELEATLKSNQAFSEYMTRHILVLIDMLEKGNWPANIPTIMEALKRTVRGAYHASAQTRVGAPERPEEKGLGCEPTDAASRNNPARKSTTNQPTRCAARPRLSS